MQKFVCWLVNHIKHAKILQLKKNKKLCSVCVGVGVGVVCVCVYMLCLGELVLMNCVSVCVCVFQHVRVFACVYVTACVCFNCIFFCPITPFSIFADTDRKVMFK